jgi:oligopeptide/dipeptide ABC transporter ATP-binding protein
MGIHVQGDAEPILKVQDLRKHFRKGSATVYAVDGVSFDLRPGETIGLVGESGSGKSTIGRTLVRLLQPTAGSIVFNGTDIAGFSQRQCKPLRKDLQFVFQNPWGALNPRMRVSRLIEEPLRLAGIATAQADAAALADKVQLNAQVLSRYPHELSGGQLQRVCIARAIASRPKVVVLDEPTSSLDLSVRAGVLELLATLQRETNAAFIFISHDLDTVRLISNRIMVLYLGRVVEEGKVEDVFTNPAHPYTQALLSSHLPVMKHAQGQRQRIRLVGEIPSPLRQQTGCSFAGRCPVVMPACTAAIPPMFPLPGTGHRAACIRVPDGTNDLRQTAIAAA